MVFDRMRKSFASFPHGIQLRMKENIQNYLVCSLLDALYELCKISGKRAFLVLVIIGLVVLGLMLVCFIY